MENGKTRLHQAQEVVEEVRIIMQENLNKSNERTGKLGDLVTRADELQEKSKIFSKTTGKVKRQKQLEHMKMKLALGGIVVVVVLGIIIVVITILIFGK